MLAWPASPRPLAWVTRPWRSDQSREVATTTPSTSASARFSEAGHCLARGEKLRLSECDLYALTLLPGVGDEVASSLLSARRSIIESARHTKDPVGAFEAAHGVGAVRARELSNFLVPE